MHALKRLMVVLVAVGCTIGLMATANATVLRTDSDVTGYDWFVGKGDVQSAFGWTAKQSDANFPLVTFTYLKVVDIEYNCQLRDGQIVIDKGTATESSSTARVTAQDTRTSKNGTTTTTVTGAYVSLTGGPTFSSSGGCSEGSAVMSTAVRTTTETLTAHSTAAGRNGVSSAVIWTALS